jgi:hypothetical protein
MQENPAGQGSKQQAVNSAGALVPPRQQNEGQEWPGDVVVGLVQKRVSVTKTPPIVFKPIEKGL